LREERLRPADVFGPRDLASLAREAIARFERFSIRIVFLIGI